MLSPSELARDRRRGRAARLRQAHALTRVSPSYAEHVLALVLRQLEDASSEVDQVWAAVYAPGLPKTDTVGSRADLVAELLRGDVELPGLEQAWPPTPGPDLESVLASHPHAAFSAYALLHGMRGEATVLP